MSSVRCIFLILCLTPLAFNGSAQGANILAISPLLSKSHHNIIRPIVAELLGRGHNVTLLSPLAEDKILQDHYNYQPVVVNFDKNVMLATFKEKDPNMFELMNFQYFFFNLLFITDMMLKVTKGALNTTNVRDFIKYDRSNYDLILCEEFNLSPFYMFAHKYNAPLVTYLTYSDAHYVSDYMGSPLNLHYVSHEFLSSSGYLSLWERLQNVICTATNLLLRKYYLMPIYNSIAKEYFSILPQPLPNLQDIERNVSLHFTNSHFAMGDIHSYLPNIVQIGGVHIQKAEPLPQDLQELMDKAKNGIIYFSFGSNVKSKHMAKEKLNAFIEVFSKLDQLVLWKYEDDILPGKPDNVITKKWFPQKDILAHPNIKLFISHGGILSTQEAIVNGVPIIGIPILGDQPATVAKLLEMGYAIRLEYKTINVETVSKAVDEVLNNPSYRRTAKEVSERFHDKPMDAMATAMYWIEYVINHKGAYHMKTPASRMPWYEYYMVDVISILILGIILFFFISYNFLKFVIKKIFIRASKQNKNTSQNKKNK